MYFWTLGAALLAASHVEGFSFSFSNKPTQCGSTTVTVDGGTPPYRLVMVPSGPLVNRPEIRTIIDQHFSSTSFTLPPLGFPGGSNFTAVMGDANGVGTGGTSVITDVASSSDESCLSTSPTTPLFFLELPANPSLVQCGSMEITFSNSAQGDVSLMGLIPGGTSFSIPVPGGARRTTWSPITVTDGTGVMLVAGDSRGRGTGGSAFIMIVQNGSDSCLNSSGGGGGAVMVYSSTNAPYAGGQYATGSGGGTVTGPWQGTTSSGSSNSGGISDPATRTAIIAGVVCGVLALILLTLLACFFLKRRRTQKARRYGGTKEVDLLKSDRQPAPVAALEGHRFEPTPFYTPPRQSFSNRTSTPPRTPDQGHRPSTSISTMEGGMNPTVASHDPLVPPSAWNPNRISAAGADSNYRSNSSSNRSDVDGTTDLGSSTHRDESEYNYVPSSPISGVGAGRHHEASKTAERPSRLQPLNIIQHEDAGAVTNTPAQAGDEEIVELPPSYNDVRQAAAAPAGNAR